MDGGIQDEITLLQLIDHAHPFNHVTEHGVTTVEMGLGAVTDEELAAAGVFARQGHAGRAAPPSPTFGQHNEDVLQDLLGVDGETYQSLVDDAVVATVPTTGEATPRVPESESLERGLIADWDPDYLKNLGLA